jgi:2-oxoglutarate dehydrogenase E1 component
MDFSYNISLLETLYESYKRDPESVDASWRHFFEGMQFASISKGPSGGAESSDLRIFLLLHAYRTYGHLMAKVNPIATQSPPDAPELDLQKLGFKKEEMDHSFPTCGFLKEPQAPLKKIVEALKQTYCRTIGVEYMGLGEPAIEAWLQKRIEPLFELQLKSEEKQQILQDLNKAEIFESFIHTKYVGQKRFSLEGGETLIPMLTAILETGAGEGVQEVTLGMSHRGRLNVLANILGKSYAHIFHEFEDHYTPGLFEGTGDVKYHKGLEGSLTTRTGKKVGVILAANPSHLESVDPVVEGQVRAQQQLKGDRTHRKEVVPILIHGDAAVAGQGVVYETMQLCRLNGYATGGTLHIVVNNQIGFTTLPKDTRSTRYCTDIARSFGAPVFHVNAEDPEGCVAVAKIAIQMRQLFECDVFIDLICYRKYGHNESDEPAFTQPIEYKLIRDKKNIREIYRDQLIQEGALSAAQAEQLENAFKADLQKALETVKSEVPLKEPSVVRAEPVSIQTAVAESTLKTLAQKCCQVPERFNPNPKVQRLLKERLEMMQTAIDWGMGETLAYASLLEEGVHVRLTGQDSRRGTFSHRHAMWVDQVNQEKYFPLSHLSTKQGLFDIFNSSLSEYASVGFEFGYSLVYLKALVLWEAQFGDFANGAQIVIDQYLASSEQKWGQRSNLALLLPHGYEGQGPEHSSARLERFLQLCGDDNMRIVNCTTPAQLFHLLRRQALDPVRKPLILFTPKAILRHPLNVSPIGEFSGGAFQEILDDPKAQLKPQRLFFCSGKIYYDLVQEREKRGKTDMAFVRIEQLYPLNQKRLKEILLKYQGFQECLWVQEEHSNMGAWEYIRPFLSEALDGKMTLRYIGRARSASPAAGSYSLHKKQTTAILDEVFK